MGLRPYQVECVSKIEESFKEFSKVLAVMATGCHEPEQGIMMFDGTIKRAKDIVVGDVLMGDDSSPRTVLRLVRGHGNMYKIYPTKGKPFTVNDEHILSLNSVQRISCGQKRGEITNISVKDYLSSTKYFKHMNKLYFNKINFEDKYDSILSPYFIGLMLGDGSINHCISFTSEDEELLSWMMAYGKNTGLFSMKETKLDCGRATNFLLSTGESGRGGSRLNKELIKLGIRHTVCENKFIPHELKTSSEENRLAVLAGLLDTDGSYTHGCYDFISKSKQLSNDVCFVARSLGMMANVVSCEKSSQNGTTGTYYRVCISGDFSSLPVRCRHKFPSKRRQIKRVNVTGIKKVESVGQGEYFGFTVDGNNLYLMDDFIVTHNCGKTVVFNSLAKKEIGEGGRVLVLAHREELLEQAANKMFMFNNIEHTIIKSGHDTDMDKMFYVGSVQSLYRKEYLERFPSDWFSLIIVDEAHHCMADTYQVIFKHFKSAKILGVTATPNRSDGKKLAKFYESMAYEYNIEDAIKDGWLSNVIMRTGKIKIDISKVRTIAGDFVINELDKAIAKEFANISEYIKTMLRGRKRILIFTPRIQSAKCLSDILSANGLNSEFVCGASKDRKDIISRFRSGETRIICNSMVLTEGFDCPEVDCVINLRPTQSKGLFTQMLGRGTRLSPGKKNLLFVDFLWKTDRDIITPCNIFSDKDVTAFSMKNFLIKNANKSYDMIELCQYFDMLFSCSEKMEEIRINCLNSIRNNGLKSYSMFAYAINNRDLIEYEPIYNWEFCPITEKQRIFLEDKCGISCKNMNKGLASKIIGVIIERANNGMCSSKQMFFIAKHGMFDKCGEMSSKDASYIIDEISKNKWKVPYHVYGKYGGDKRLTVSLLKYKNISIKPVDEEEGLW